MAKINEDPRGLFVELLKNGLKTSKLEVETYTQLSYLTINPNFFRGHHYHDKNIEAFILLEGDCNLIQTGETNEGYEIALKPFEIEEVLPGMQHTLTSRKGAKLLVLSTESFDPNNPDVFTYENPRNSSNKK